MEALAVQKQKVNKWNNNKCNNKDNIVSINTTKHIYPYIHRYE